VYITRPSPGFASAIADQVIVEAATVVSAPLGEVPDPVPLPEASVPVKHPLTQAATASPSPAVPDDAIVIVPPAARAFAASLR